MRAMQCHWVTEQHGEQGGENKPAHLLLALWLLLVGASHPLLLVQASLGVTPVRCSQAALATEETTPGLS